MLKLNMRTALKLSIVGLILMVMAVVSGCALLSNEISNMNEALKGKTATIQTYDADGQVIDKIRGKSISLEADDKFAIKNADGVTVDKSSVISATIGGKSMVHVGSSLILWEDGLENKFDQFAKTVDFTNMDKSTPFVNRMINNMKNSWTGQNMLILVRSQAGKPIAAFSGQKVSYFATKIDKSTGILIDGKRLFIYRSDYTMYDMDLLKNTVE